MNRKILTIFLISTVLLLGCGKKEPTLTEVQSRTQTNILQASDLHSDVSMSVNLALSNVSDNSAAIIQEVNDYYGLDFSTPMQFNVDIINSEKSFYTNRIVYTESLLKEAYTSTNETLTNEISSLFNIINTEEHVYSYGNVSENTIYYSFDNDKWYSQYQNSFASADQTIINQQSLAEDMLNFIGSEKTEVYSENINGVEYKSYRYSFDFSRDYYNQLSVEKAKYLQTLANETISDYELTSLLDVLDKYSDYAEINIPVTLSIIYKNIDNKYYLTECRVDIDVNAAVNITPEQLSKLGISQYSYGFTGNILLNISVFDKEIPNNMDLSTIPSNIIDSALYLNPDSILPLAYDYDNDRYYYTLLGDNGQSIFNFSQVINGWSIDENISSANGTEYIYIDSNDNKLTITCYVPDNINKFYTNGSTENLLYIDHIVTEYNPYGYDIFMSGSDIYAVYYTANANNSVVLKLTYNDEQSAVNVLSEILSNYF